MTQVNGVGGQPAIQEDELDLDTLSGHKTPTRSPTPKFSTFPAEKEKGTVTPRAGSPLLSADVERTPRLSFDWARSFRGSL